MRVRELTASLGLVGLLLAGCNNADPADEFQALCLEPGNHVSVTVESPALVTPGLDLVLEGGAAHSQGLAIRQLHVEGIAAESRALSFSEWSVTLPWALLEVDEDFGSITLELEAEALDSCGREMRRGLTVSVVSGLGDDDDVVDDDDVADDDDIADDDDAVDDDDVVDDDDAGEPACGELGGVTVSFDALGGVECWTDFYEADVALAVYEAGMCSDLCLPGVDAGKLLLQPGYLVFDLSSLGCVATALEVDVVNADTASAVVVSLYDDYLVDFDTAWSLSTDTEETISLGTGPQAWVGSVEACDAQILELRIY